MITIKADGIAALLSLVYDTHPHSRIEQIKLVRSITGMGLKVSKLLMDAEQDRRSPADSFAKTIESIVVGQTPDMGTRGPLLKSILRRLRETASNCPDAGTRSALQDHANLMAVCMQRLAFSYKDADLREMNGLWVRAYVMLDAAQKPGAPSDPTSHQQLLEQLAA